MKKLILILIFSIILISFASAQQQSLGEVKQDDCIDLTQSCASCTYNNITSIIYPNKTKYVFSPEQNMTKSGIDYTFHTCNFSSQLDEYIINGQGDLSGTDTIWNYNYIVTPSGRAAPTSGEGMTYLASIGSMILITIFFFCISFAIKPESALRFVFIALSFVMAIITVLYSFVAINETLAGFTNIIDSFSTFHYVLLILLFVIFIFVLLAITFKALEMLKLKKGLKVED